MADGQMVSGFALASILSGVVLVVAAIKGWSLGTALQDVISGKAPSTSQAPGTLVTIGIQTGTNSTSSYAPGALVRFDAISPTNAAGPPSTLSTLTETQIKDLWTENGGDSETSGIAYAVAMAESGGRTVATSNNVAGCLNYGLYQLAMPCGVGAGYTADQLNDPATNTQITIMATVNGTDWSQWNDPVVNALPGGQYAPGAPIP